MLTLNCIIDVNDEKESASEGIYCVTPMNPKILKCPLNDVRIQKERKG